jgi:hypothetical protein
MGFESQADGNEVLLYLHLHIQFHISIQDINFYQISHMLYLNIVH